MLRGNEKNIVEIEERLKEHLKIEDQVKSGANWFFWIAGLSIINTIIFLTGAQWSFVVGLGITQLITGVALEFGSLAEIIAFILTLIFAGIFIFFGIFSRKRYNWAFVVGMILYVLDGLLLLLVQDWLSFGFHAFALFWIYRGLRANLKYSVVQGTFSYRNIAKAGLNIENQSSVTTEEGNKEEELSLEERRRRGGIEPFKGER